MLEVDLSSDYELNVSAVTNAGFAIWDVLADCQRPGSLDSNIVRSSEKCNDFRQFLTNHPSIKLIAFNGKAAEQIFMRHCAELLSSNISDNTCVKSVQLPSTSPAHARLNKHQKLALWQQRLSYRPINNVDANLT